MTDHPVIDLSHWNEIVDFQAILDADVIGVIHKCTEGDDYNDPTYDERRAIYHQRREGALTAGLLWGAYHFLRPGDMRAQAKWFVEQAGDERALLYAADHEDAGVSLDDLKLFLATVTELTGRLPALYSGNVIKEQVGDTNDPELARYRLWLAQYTSGEPSWPDKTWSTWWLWQYTDQGEVPGINGNVDLNYYCGDDDMVALISEWSGDAPAGV